MSILAGLFFCRWRAKMTTQAIDFLTMDEVLERLRVSRATLYNLIDRRGFPLPVKLGRSNRWRQCEVEDWMEARPRAQIQVREKEPAMQ